MTEDDFAKSIGARRKPWLRWGCLSVYVLLIAGLAVVAVSVYSMLRKADPERQLTLQVETIKSNLQAAADDGVLTDEEIMRITSRDSGGDPGVRHENAQISFDTPVNAVTSSPFGSSGRTSCYTFTVFEPLSRSSTVTATKIASCE